MGFLKKMFSRSRATVQMMPTGSLTVDRYGEVLTSTVSSAYPKDALREIGREVLRIFYEARTAQMPLGELSLNFGALRITARELRGGAVIFLFPQTAMTPTT